MQQKLLKARENSNILKEYSALLHLEKKHHKQKKKM